MFCCETVDASRFASIQVGYHVANKFRIDHINISCSFVADQQQKYEWRGK